MPGDYKIIVGREIKRRKMLALLNQDEYISRFDLPGALATNRAGIGRSDLTDHLSERVVGGELADQASRLNFKDKAFVEISSENSDSSSFIDNQALAFSLVGVYNDRYLWVENVTNDPFSEGQFQLIMDMNFAMEGRIKSLGRMQFDWPLHDNSSLDHGIDAARASFRGYLDRLWFKNKWEKVFLLGDPNPITVSSFTDFCSCEVLSYSSREMISQPERKRTVWTELQKHAV